MRLENACRLLRDLTVILVGVRRRVRHDQIVVVAQRLHRRIERAALRLERAAARGQHLHPNDRAHRFRIRCATRRGSRRTHRARAPPSSTSRTPRWSLKTSTPTRRAAEAGPREQAAREQLDVVAMGADEEDPFGERQRLPCDVAGVMHPRGCPLEPVRQRCRRYPAEQLPQALDRGAAPDHAVPAPWLFEAEPILRQVVEPQDVARQFDDRGLLPGAHVDHPTRRPRGVQQYAHHVVDVGEVAGCRTAEDPDATVDAVEGANHVGNRVAVAARRIARPVDVEQAEDRVREAPRSARRSRPSAC